jgi:hypothetical protein
MKLALIVGMLVALAIHTAAFGADKPGGKNQFQIYGADVVVGVSRGGGTPILRGKDWPITTGAIGPGATNGAASGSHSYADTRSACVSN